MPRRNILTEGQHSTLLNLYTCCTVLAIWAKEAYTDYGLATPSTVSPQTAANLGRKGCVSMAQIAIDSADNMWRPPGQYE